MKNYFVVFAFDKTILMCMKYAILLILIYTNYALASERITTKIFKKMMQLVSEKKSEFGRDQWYNKLGR